MPFTNVLIYQGEFMSDDVIPIDDPAIIKLKKGLLIKSFKKPISLEEFKKQGGEVISRINLPSDGLLKPIGTAAALARCFCDGLLDNM